MLRKGYTIFREIIVKRRDEKTKGMVILIFHISVFILKLIFEFALAFCSWDYVRL